MSKVVEYLQLCLGLLLPLITFGLQLCLGLLLPLITFGLLPLLGTGGVRMSKVLELILNNLQLCLGVWQFTKITPVGALIKGVVSWLLQPFGLSGTYCTLQTFDGRVFKKVNCFVLQPEISFARRWFDELGSEKLLVKYLGKEFFLERRGSARNMLFMNGNMCYYITPTVWKELQVLGNVTDLDSSVKRVISAKPADRRARHAAYDVARDAFAAFSAARASSDDFVFIHSLKDVKDILRTAARAARAAQDAQAPDRDVHDAARAAARAAHARAAEDAQATAGDAHGAARTAARTAARAASAARADARAARASASAARFRAAHARAAHARAALAAHARAAGAAACAAHDAARASRDHYAFTRSLKDVGDIRRATLAARAARPAADAPGETAARVADRLETDLRFLTLLLGLRHHYGYVVLKGHREFWEEVSTGGIMSFDEVLDGLILHNQHLSLPLADKWLLPVKLSVSEETLLIILNMFAVILQMKKEKVPWLIPISLSFILVLLEFSTPLRVWLYTIINVLFCSIMHSMCDRLSRPWRRSVYSLGKWVENLKPTNDIQLKIQRPNIRAIIAGGTKIDRRDPPVASLVEVPWLPVAEENGDVISNLFRCKSIGIDMTCTYFVALNRCQIDAPTVSMFTVECKGMEEYRRIITLVSSMAKNGCGSLKSYGPHHKVSVRGFRESVLCYVKSGFPRVYELPLEDIVLT